MTATFLRRAACALVLGAAVVTAAQAADEWAPTRPVHVIVPLPGSTVDALARIVQPELQKALGQPIIVEDRPVAGGNIGADYVAKSVPDGHTLLFGFNAALEKKKKIK